MLPSLAWRSEEQESVWELESVWVYSLLTWWRLRHSRRGIHQPCCMNEPGNNTSLKRRVRCSSTW